MSSNICAILEQRRQLAKLRKPQNRYEGLSNPYVEPGITQYQLDMRRKAEILQYKKHAISTNRMTARGRYATVLNEIANDICPGDLALPTLSSSSDVPGPITTLKYDEKIPLYNLASNADNYANLTENPDKNAIFTLYAEKNVLFQTFYDSNNNRLNPGATVTFASMTIDNPTESNTMFNLSIPIGIYVSVDVSRNVVYNATYRIRSPEFGVYYNGSKVPTTESQSFTSIITTVFSNFGTTVDPEITTLSGVKYVGNLTISNLTLPTQAGYVYEFRMSAIPELLSQISGVYTSRVFGMFVNVSTNRAVNCTMTTPTPLTNPGTIIINTV